MPNYCVRWPNGDFSVVSAKDKVEAVMLLDEEGDADMCDIHPLPNFMAHFTLGDDGFLELL